MLAMSFVVVSNARAQVTIDTDSSTTLTLNAKYPKLYWVGFNDSVAPAYTNIMGTQVSVGNTYVFSLDFNYSFGSANCDFTIYAWYDGGAVPVPYPAAPDATTRNLAFQVDCTFAGVVTVTYPNAPILEVTTPGVADIQMGYFDPLYPGQEHYEVFIPVHFGEQLRAAPVNGYNTYSFDPLVGHQTQGTWDFDVVVRDTLSAATNTGYGEFGIQKMVTNTVSGNPVGNAPPGGSTGWMLVQSVITYSSNTDYYVTVEIDDLLDSGLGEYVTADNVEVQNLHPDSGASDIGAATFFTDSGTPLYVWGSLNVPVMASNHGTFSAGPSDSNFLTPGTTTRLQWRVTVPAGTSEGVYTSTIYVTIFDSDHPIILATNPVDLDLAVPTVAGTFVVTFSEPMDLAVPALPAVNTNLPGAIVSWNVGTGNLEIAYDALDPDTVYYVDLSGQGYQDLDGNALAGDMYYQFRTQP
jgi:hypothetical protein